MGVLASVLVTCVISALSRARAGSSMPGRRQAAANSFTSVPTKFTRFTTRSEEAASQSSIPTPC